MIFIKELKFLYLHFSRPDWTKRLFGNVPDTKWAFWTKTTLTLERCKISIFYKGVSSYFWSKISSLVTLFLLQISSYLGVEIFAFFPKGLVHDFDNKFVVFFTFTFLGQIHQKESLAMFLIENELFDKNNIDIRKL